MDLIDFDADEFHDPDWWRSGKHLELLTRSFLADPVIGLAAHLEGGAPSLTEVATGFAIFHAGFCWWVTAGHVVQSLKSMAEDPRYAVKEFCFCDGYFHPDACTIPVAADHLRQAWDHYEPGLDIGMLPLRDIYLRPLAASNAFTPLDERGWQGMPNSDDDRYFVVGLPRESIDGAQATLRCVPLKRIESKPKRHASDPFWGRDHAFYAEVIDILDDGDHPPVRDIRGMSGGPVYQIGRDKNKKLRFWLVGVQSDWLPNSRVICATGITHIRDLFNRMKRIMDELDNGGGANPESSE